MVGVEEYHLACLVGRLDSSSSRLNPLEQTMNILVKLVRLAAFIIWVTLRVIEAILGVIIVTLAWFVAPKAMLGIRFIRPRRNQMHRSG
jgi:hypothetical protein